jgi:hypothetical protein
MSSNFCTYFDWNYRHKGYVLWESLEQHCPNYHLWILALDDATLNGLVRLNLPNVSIIAMSSFEDDALRAVKPARSLREYYWTCTPGWTLFVLRNGSVDHVNYVDADMMFFADPQPVFDEIGAESLAVTPHDFPPRLKFFESNGKYNVGLVHTKKDADGLACIEEWQRLCLDWCYLRHEPLHPERFCDQKYWDSILEKHWHVHAIQHPGANRAPWNAEHHEYSVKDGQVCVDAQPLLWWHYHGFEGEHQMYPSTYVVSDLQRRYIYVPYLDAIRRAQLKW